MLAIPSALQAQFEEYLRNKEIANSLQGAYKKWLRYVREVAKRAKEAASVDDYYRVKHYAELCLEITSPRDKNASNERH